MTWGPEYPAGGSSSCYGGGCSSRDGESGRPADHGRQPGGGISELLHYQPPYAYTTTSKRHHHHFFHEPRSCRLRRNIVSITYGVMLGMLVWLCLYTLSFSCCVVGNDARYEGSEYVGKSYGTGGGGNHVSNPRTIVREVTLTRSGPNPLQEGVRRTPSTYDHHLSRRLEEDDMIYTLPDDPDERPSEDRDEQFHQHREPLSSGHNNIENKHTHSLQTLGGSNSAQMKTYPKTSKDYNQRDPQNININNNNYQQGDSDNEEDNEAYTSDNRDSKSNKFDTSNPPRRKSKDKYKTDSSASFSTRTKQGYSRKLPNGLIIGVKKGGTRALLEFLRIHPDIRAPGPEPHFFDRNYERGLDWYRRQMPPTLDSQLTIEKSPSYFVTRGVPGKIYNMSRDTKILVVVRDPVTRAISDYTQSASKRPDMKPFVQMAFLDNNTGLVDTSWGAIRIGVYAKHLERWLKYFPLSQIHFVNGEKLVSNPASELEKVQDFLGLKRVITDKHFYFNSTKGFPCLKKPEGSGSPHCLGKTKGRPHPKVDPKVIKRLHDFFRPFNAKFYQMTGMDFGWP